MPENIGCLPAQIIVENWFLKDRLGLDKGEIIGIIILVDSLNATLCILIYNKDFDIVRNKLY